VAIIYSPPLLVLLGLTPSLFWLFLYLRKDLHPEPRSLIIKVFFMGIVIAPLAVIFQWLTLGTGKFFNPDFQSSESILFFLIAAFIEEVVKYLAVRFTVLNNADFDEPVDAMIYMIIAALGFAGIENILVLFKTLGDITTENPYIIFQVLGLRFVGATLLHALSSAIAGYFLAMSWFYSHHSKKLVTFGILIATLFHTTFNIIILKSALNQDISFYLMPLLIFMAILISILFNRLKKRRLVNTIEY